MSWLRKGVGITLCKSNLNLISKIIYQSFPYNFITRWYYGSVILQLPEYFTQRVLSVNEFSFVHVGFYISMSPSNRPFFKNYICMRLRNWWRLLLYLGNNMHKGDCCNFVWLKQKRRMRRLSKYEIWIWNAWKFWFIRSKARKWKWKDAFRGRRRKSQEWCLRISHGRVLISQECDLQYKPGREV